MKAWKLSKQKLNLVTELPNGTSTSQNIKIKMDKVLFGKNDYYIYNGIVDAPDDIVPGSIGVGVVSEVFDSSAARFARMDRVVIEPYLACRECRFCKQDTTVMCLNKQKLGINADGLLQDFICLPQKCIFKIPDPVSSDDALLTNDISLALNIIDKINMDKGDHVAIFGGGRLGVVLACLVIYYQAVPIFVEHDESIINIALGKNIFYAFDAQKNIKDNIFNATGGRLCEKVVFFAESGFNISTAVDACGVNGVLCVSGTIIKKSELNLSVVQKKSITVNGVENCFGNFPSALNLLTKGIVKATDFVCKELAFADLDKTLPDITELQTATQNIVVKCE